MKKLIVPLALLMMAALLGAAASLDCVRLAADARKRVTLADAELLKHETRLINSLNSAAKLSSEVQAAIVTYKGAATEQARHEAYQQLVATFRKTSSPTIDPTNPLDRKLMDDTAGAINRREIAEKQYDDENAVYQRFLNSWRGSLARVFSSQARADWKSH